MNTKRPRGTPFTPGNQHGKGRPAGSRNKVTLVIEQLLEGEAEAIVRKAVDRAKKGDTTALRLCLERLYPPRRERPLRLELPEIHDADGLPEAIRVILRELAQGNVTTSEAEGVTKVLEFGRKAFEMQELARRLAHVEKALQEVLAIDERRAA